jgi:outer membrane protein, heavy metal efflux system
MKPVLAASAGAALSMICILTLAHGAAQPPDSTAARPDMRGRAELVRAGGGDTLRLAEVERIVLARNPTLEAAAQSVRAALARAEVAGALADPRVGVMVAPNSFGRDPGATSAHGAPGIPMHEGYRFEVSQALPLPGQRGLRRRAASAEARAIEYQERVQRLDVLREARTAYFDYERIGRALEVNREQQALVGQLRRSALVRYSAGLVGQQDPLQADMELAMLDHEAVALERERRIAVARLNSLMRRPPDEELPPPQRDLAVPDTSFVHSDLAPRARALRPELRAAAERVDARRAELTLSGRSRLPEPTVSVAYDHFMMDPEHRAIIGLELNLPIHLARLGSARREARAMLAAAEAEREAAYLEIERQVEEAASRLHEAAHEIPIARDRLLPSSERALRVARAEYEAGRADFQTVIAAARQRVRAQLFYHETLARLRVAGAELERSLGDPAPGSSTEEHP